MVQDAVGGKLQDNNMGRILAFANADTGSSLNSHDLQKSQLTTPLLPGHRHTLPSCSPETSLQSKK